MIHPLRPAALALTGAAALLAGCNQAPDDAAPAPALTTSAARTADASGEALTEGSWRIEETANGASAAFGTPAGEPLFRLVCRRADRAVVLARSGVEPRATTFRVEAGGLAADVAMVPGEPGAGDTGEVEAVVDPSQPIFAAFADPAATIRVTGSGIPALHLPTHTGTSRVVQACS